MQKQQKPFTKFKIVFIGDQAVGKTSIIQRFIYDQIPTIHQPTIGIDFLSKCISIDGKTVRLQLWDTAGQERFRSLIPSYIRDSQAVVLCYDVSNSKSFQNIKNWLEYVREERGTDVLAVLIANKIDIIDDRVVSTEEGEKLAKEEELLYFEVSAKDGTHIQKTFKLLTQKLLGPNDATPEGQESETIQPEISGGVQLQKQPEIVHEDATKCGC